MIYDKFRPTQFPPTTWGGSFEASSWESMVMKMTPAQREAWDHIIGKYWDPANFRIERKGFAADDAYDLTQEFFIWMMRNNIVARADRSKGRFRDFLIKVLNDWLVDNHRKSTAQKRGGHTLHLALDAAIDGHHLDGFIEEITPEHELMYERWRQLCAAADATLERGHRSAGTEKTFELLYPLLYRLPKEGEYDHLSILLKIDTARVAKRVFLFRKAWRLAILDEARERAQGTADPEQEVRDIEEWLALAKPGRG